MFRMRLDDDLPDILDGDWDPSAWWSRANAGEAMPGVLTPLTWSFWGPTAERAARRAFVAVGALERKGAALPRDPRDRMLAPFRGRVAAKVDFIGAMGDRLPGTSGASVAEQVLGTLPEDFVSTPTKRRLPVVAVRFPIAAACTPRRLRKAQRETSEWWRYELDHGTLDLQDAQRLWRAATARFEQNMVLQITAVFAVVQPLYEALGRLATAAGDPGLAARLLAGQGSHAEMQVVDGIWRVSRGELSLEEFVARNGFHGPSEGELAGRVWREDRTPVESMVARYRDKPDSESPEQTARERAADRARAEVELRSALPRAAAPVVTTVLTLVRKQVPLRGIGKKAFLQTIDVGRFAAREMGIRLSEAGSLDDPADVFMLTSDELLAADGRTGLQGIVAARRKQRSEHETVHLPSAWRGRPPVRTAGSSPDDVGVHLTGVAASPGVVEGRARVILDPDFDDTEPGEILIAPTTDPSWAPIMYISGALVVDIGGTLSHAAIIAREMGVPCIMGTGNGTTLLRTGDLIRVDGNAGTVDRLGPPPADPTV